MNNLLRQAGGVFSRWSVSSRLCCCLGVLVMSVWISGADAQVDAAREFRNDLFPPDLILREASALGLTDQQRDAVAALVKETKKAFGDARPKLQDTTGVLAETLKSTSVSEQAALDQFTATLDVEKEMKRAQFLMLVRAKNLLTPEQQEKLRVIVQNQPPKDTGKKAVPASGPTDVRQELNTRMQKVQVGVDRWRREGRDPGPILELMKTFGEQMQAGQMPEAKETLQRALERLNAPERP